MKKALIMGSALGFLAFAVPVTANNGGAPVVSGIIPTVSIGVGNSNIPANTAPAHESEQLGAFDVYATVQDDNLENYHFRVVKEGGVDGYTCLASEALFAPENQGYASTTLGKDACGFNFNQSIYTSTSFLNEVIASLNTDDLVSFGGLGDYWLILGARDSDGNRSAVNYLDDPKVKITIVSTTTPTSPVTPTDSNGGDSTGGGSTDSGSNSGGSSSTGGSSSGGSSSGLGGHRRDISGIGGDPGGAVLGISTGPACEDYLTSYIKYGAENDPEEVKKLQIFLNQFFEVNNPVTGFYGPITLDMVNKFQKHQEVAVLLPWELAGYPTYGPTGYVYKTTKRWINILKCPMLIATSPIPQLP